MPPYSAPPLYPYPLPSRSPQRSPSSRLAISPSLYPTRDKRLLPLLSEFLIRAILADEESRILARVIAPSSKWREKLLPTLYPLQPRRPAVKAVGCRTVGATKKHPSRSRDLPVTFAARVPRAEPDALGHLREPHALRVVNLAASAALQQLAAVVADKAEVLMRDGGSEQGGMSEP